MAKKQETRGRHKLTDGTKKEKHVIFVMEKSVKKLGRAKVKQIAEEAVELAAKK